MHVQQLGLGIAVVAAATAVAREIVDGRVLVTAGIVGLVFVVALTQAGWLPYVATTALVASFASPVSFSPLAVPGNPTLPDLVLAAAFAAWFLSLARGSARLPSFVEPIPVAIAVLLCATVAGVLVGTTNGTTFGFALVGARDASYYATFWLALTALATPHDRKTLLRIFAYAAVLIVCAQVLQAVVGPDRLLFYDRFPLQELITCSSGPCPDPAAEGFPRVRPPGLSIVYVVACFSAAYLLWGPPRRRGTAIGLLTVCVLGMLISLNRNMIVGVLGGLVLTAILARRRGRFAVTLGVGAIVAVVAVTALGQSRAVKESSLLARVVSLTDVSQLERSGTVTDRLQENAAAFKTLSESPILGVGWGVPYGMEGEVWMRGEFRFDPHLFIHNQYLGLWLRSGLAGLVAFIGALVVAVAYGIRWLRASERLEQSDAWLGAAVVTSLTAIGLSSIVAIYVIHPSWAPVTAGVLALACTLRRQGRFETPVAA